MHIAINDHQDKSQMLRQALEKRGHKVTGAREYGDCLLIDYDGPVGNYQPMIEAHVIHGAKVFLYQHGANVMTHYDGIHVPSDRVSGFFTFAPGYKWVMEKYGYPHPIHVVGWYYSPLAQWQPCAQPTKILYAPWHPLQTGFIPPMGKQLNHEIHEELVKLKKQFPTLVIQVRHIGRLAWNNIEPHPLLTYKQVRAKNEWDDIEWADVIISHGSFARLAVARGKPTVFYGQQQTPYDGNTPANFKTVKNYHEYRHYMTYPYDYDFGETLWDSIEVACSQDPIEWKEKFIGQPFDEVLFDATLKQLVLEQVHA